MEVIALLQDGHPQKKQGLVLALGDFDGVHLGHRKLIEEGKTFAGERPFGVFLFENDPSLYLPNGKGKRFLSALEDKLFYLNRAGANLAYVAEVSESFFSLSPREFIEQYLIPLGVEAVAVGEDYRFGKGAQGTPELLKEYFDVHVTKLLFEGNEKIASRSIKALVEDGQIETVNALLGHPYRVQGQVKEGLHNGRKIGFPTINVHSEFPYLLPKVGVYAGIVEIGGGTYHSIINVGSNPTIGVLDHPILEAHLKDFKENVYGEECRVSFLTYLRPEIKFASLNELKDQLQEDLKKLP